MEQERGLLAACDCGRDCDCDRDCHYDCDCEYDRHRVRCTDGTRSLPTDGHSAKPSITVREHASCKGLGSGGGCTQEGVGCRRSRSRGQDPEQEQTREQGRGGAVATCDCGRDCDCDRDCHYGCDCDSDRDRARCTDGTHSFLATVALQDCPAMVTTIVIVAVLVRSLLAQARRNSLVEAHEGARDAAAPCWL